MKHLTNSTTTTTTSIILLLIILTSSLFSLIHQIACHSSSSSSSTNSNTNNDNNNDNNNNNSHFIIRSGSHTSRSNFYYYHDDSNLLGSEANAANNFQLPKIITTTTTTTTTSFTSDEEQEEEEEEENAGIFTVTKPTNKISLQYSCDHTSMSLQRQQQSSKDNEEDEKVILDWDIELLEQVYTKNNNNINSSSSSSGSSNSDDTLESTEEEKLFFIRITVTEYLNEMTLHHSNRIPKKFQILLEPKQMNQIAKNGMLFKEDESIMNSNFTTVKQMESFLQLLLESFRDESLQCYCIQQQQHATSSPSSSCTFLNLRIDSSQVFNFSIPRIPEFPLDQSQFVYYHFTTTKVVVDSNNNNNKMLPLVSRIQPQLQDGQYIVIVRFSYRLGIPTMRTIRVYLRVDEMTNFELKTLKQQQQQQEEALQHFEEFLVLQLSPDSCLSLVIMSSTAPNGREDSGRTKELEYSILFENVSIDVKRMD